MKNKYIKYAMQHLSALMLVILTGFMTLNVDAQTIDGITTSPDNSATYYTGDDTDATVTYTTTGAFDVGTKFYLHTGAFEEDNVLGSATGTGAGGTDITFTWPYSGTGSENFTITAATGDFAAETIDFDPDLASKAGGTFSSPNFNMNGVGLRRVTFQPLDTDYTEDVVLNLSFDGSNVVDLRPIVVQYSVNGTSFFDMTDTNDDNEWFATAGTVNLQFLLTSGQKDASVTIRVLQKNSNSLTSGAETWTLSESVSIAAGGIVEVTNAFVDTYDIDVPSVSISGFFDEDDNPTGTFYAGQSVKIEGTYTGADGRVNDYNYQGIFTNGDGDQFKLESLVESNDGTSVITVTGVIPATVVYGENWNVELRAFTTTTAILGYEFETDFNDGNQTKLTYVGGTVSSQKALFNQDDVRSLSTQSINVGTVTNSYLTFTLKKESVGLSPTGTEIEVSFSTNAGSTFTVLDEFSLNADLSDPITIDTWPAGTVSSATIFKISQKSNNGAGLSTWSVDDLTLSVGGNIITNSEIIEYSTSNIDIDAPVIALEAVNVPSALIYPGDEVDLVYNITNGAYPVGTTLSAIFDHGSSNPRIVGTSSLITPGDSEDHEITITVPPYVGGTYDIHLIPSTDTEESSNSVSLPIYNTTITITEVTSDSGVEDGGLSVVYPGDAITVNYILDGSVGSGAELMLEILDQDQDVEDNDGYVFVTSISTGLSGGVITGTLPTNINFDDGGSPMIRLKIGNGVLATTGLTFAKNDNGDDANGINLFTNPYFFLEENVIGNRPVAINNGDYDNFISSGERSATSVIFDYSFGGTASISLFDENYSFDQMVYLQGSTNGTTWVTIDEEEYTGSDFTLSSVVPAALWSATTRFRFIMNEDGAAAEFENELYVGSATFQVNTTSAANSATFDLTSQFRKPTVNLEELDSYDFIVGEALTIEYTTEGPFPANTGFAIVLEGPDNLETVVGTSTGTGLASVSVTMPSFAFEDNPDDTDELYNNLKVVAYDATGGASYTPDETIVLDDDEFFITIEGTDEEDGTYTFDQIGNRSLLTDAFDISAADEVTVDFTISSIGVSEMDNKLTMPVFQVSTNGGTSFTNVAIEEDGILGDGYIFKNMSFSADLPAGMITAATHFRWYQPLNLGANTDAWTISSISITLVTGNEITTYYSAGNSDVASTLAHPSLGDFAWEQDNADTDPIFNGESFTYSVTKLYETTKNFPSGTQFDYILWDGSEYIIDPTTNRPYIIATASAIGSGLSAEIPFFVEEGSYTVRLIASKAWEDDETYFYAGMSDGTSSTDVGTVDVFLRVVRTVFDFDANDIFYAGSSATFKIEIENDDLNTLDLSTIYANLLVKNFDGGDDLLLMSQQGVADITLDLPPFLRGQSYEFSIELSEGAPLGEDWEILGNSDLSNLENDADNFINASHISSDGTITTPILSDNPNSNSGYVQFYFDYESTGDNVYLDYKYTNGSWNSWYNLSNYSRTNEYRNYYFGNIGSNKIQFRLRIDGSTDNTRLAVREIKFDDAQININSLSPNDVIEPGLLTFSNDEGRGLITTKAFEAGLLDNSTLIAFDLTFGKLAKDITSSQFLIFEYSTNGGSSYTEVSSFPDVDEDEHTLSGDSFLFEVTDDMKSSASIFRFRQEERNNINVEIDNFSFKMGETLPFDYISDNQTIAKQTLLITGISVDEVCSEGDVSLDYEIRGVFGINNLVDISYRGLSGGVAGNIEGYQFNLVSGTGTIDFQLPNGLLEAGDNNAWINLRLKADDDTYEDDDLDFTSDGPYSEMSIEVVAPINTDGSFDVTSQQLCDLQDIIVTVNNVQDYFTYDIFDTADGSILGSLTYDPEIGETEINIGEIAEPIEIGLTVTSISSSGTLTCNSISLNEKEEIVIMPNYALYDSRDYGDTFKISSGNTETICEGDDRVYLRVGRINSNTTSVSYTSSVNWYMDGITDPVGSGDWFYEFPASGDYFAKVTDGECSYVTESITIVVNEQMDAPEITIVSGNLTFCEGAEEVVLEGPAGFTYYQWDSGETTQQITVDEAGSYSVKVSNSPFGIDNCSESPYSEPIEIETTELIDLKVQRANSSDVLYSIQSGEVLSACDSKTIYFYDENTTSFGGAIVLYKDGVEYKSTTGSNISIEDSGEYFAEWISDDNESACTVVSNTFIVEIFDIIEDAPVITSSGALIFCEGGSATLTAETGFTFYRWYRDGSVINSDAEVITVEIDGTYQVEVSNVPFANSCFSPRSQGVDIVVYGDPDLYIATSDNATALKDGEEVVACSENLLELRAWNTGGNPVKWYRDGTLISASGNTSGTNSGSYIIPKQSGVFHAEVTIGGNNVANQCIFSTASIVFVYNEKPTPVVITQPTLTDFCEGEVDVTLTATTGSALYRWYRANVGNTSYSSITNGTGSANSLAVTAEGKYYVTVADDEGCESDPSNVITITSQPLADPFININTLSADCATGDVVIQLTSTDAETTYQLRNYKTGEAVGAQVNGNNQGDPVYVTLPGLTEPIDLMVEATYADGSGCANTSDYEGTATPDNVVLELDGNTLQAMIYGDDIEYTWYRNGVKLRNATGSSITVTDGATYSIEVLFVGGCSVVSNSIDLGTEPEPEPEEEPVAIAASTFPNPTTDVMNLDIDGGNMGSYDIILMTITGQVVLSHSVEKDVREFSVPIDVKSLQTGVYNLRVSKGGEYKNIRILKN